MNIFNPQIGQRRLKSSTRGLFGCLALLISLMHVQASMGSSFDSLYRSYIDSAIQSKITAGLCGGLIGYATCSLINRVCRKFDLPYTPFILGSVSPAIGAWQKSTPFHRAGFGLGLAAYAISCRFAEWIKSMQYVGEKPHVGDMPREFEELIRFCKNPAKRAVYRAFNMPIEQGLLLYGPYGTGKTALVLKLAQKIGDLPCIVKKSTELTSHLVHYAAHNITNLFKEARGRAKRHPLKTAIICIDEIDALCPSFNGRQDTDLIINAKATIAALKNETGGIGKDGVEIILIGCTNYIKKIDPGVLRAGRIGKHIYIGYLKPPDIVKMLNSYFIHHDIITANEEQQCARSMNTIAIILMMANQCKVTPAMVVDAVKILISSELEGNNNDDIEVIRNSLRAKLMGRPAGVERCELFYSDDLD